MFSMGFRRELIPLDSLSFQAEYRDDPLTL